MLGSAQIISISPLLKSLAGDSGSSVTPGEIASAFALIFDNQLSAIQCSSLLTLLHVSKRDREPEVIALCAGKMRDSAAQVDRRALREVVRKRGQKEGGYRGGLCDIVGMFIRRM